MTVDSEAKMDELPSLSFTSKYPPKTQIYGQQGTANGNVDRNGAVCKPVSRGLSCSTCGQTFVAEHLLQLHKKVSNCNNSALQSLLMPGGAASVDNGARVDRTQPCMPGSLPQQRGGFSGHCTRNQKRLYQAFAQNKARKQRRNMPRWPKWDDSRPLVAFWATKRPRKVSPERHPSSQVRQGEFMSQCGLIASTKAVDLKRSERSTSSEDVVDLDSCQLEAMACESLTSPQRTTRSLMSQFSREHPEVAKKRLSFCIEPDQDAEGSSEGETLDTTAARRSVQVSLLAVDFSSPLGQRVKKHVKADLTVAPIADIEQHCLTVPVLDEMAAKLRHRANEYPIMHRKRKGIVTGYCHTFKFNKAERREFLRTFQTGLNARSRRLLKLTKKCSVRLARLRSEVIRYWTIKRRTIVNEEITIDDDLSIVQVDVPEHLFNAVRKMAVVPSHRTPLQQQQQHYGGPVRDGRYFPGQGGYPMGYQGHAHRPSHSQHGSQSHRTPYPLYPPSSSHQGPVPQFLVKQVSKNWTENGQESQKLVFVPLDESGPSHSQPHPVRGLTGGPAHGPSQQHNSHANRGIAGASVSHPNRGVAGGSNDNGAIAGGSSALRRRSSSGIKKSLPRHLRPCPKSQRKHRQPHVEDEDFAIETASSSSEEAYDLSSTASHHKGKKSKEKEDVYPLSMSSIRDGKPSSWAMEGPVPQMLHVANSASAGVPVSGIVSFPAGLVPVSSWEHHHHLEALKVNQTAFADTMDHHSELRKHLTLFPHGAGMTSLSKNMGDETADKKSHLAGGRDNFLLHTSVHRAPDHPKSSVVSLSSASSRRPATTQQPNFLQLPPEPPKLYDSSSFQPRPQNAHSNCSMPRLVQGPQAYHPSSSSSSSSKHQMGRHSTGHQPAILRAMAKTHNPASSMKPAPGMNPAPSVKSGAGSMKTDADLRHVPKKPSSDWTVIRASDDDVVEVICIDDD